MEQTKKESSKMAQATESRPAPPALERRAARTDQGLMITCIDRQYRIRGVSLHNFERLRVNIRASQGTVFHIDSLDLYQSRARRAFAAHLAKLFQVELPMIEADLLYMIGVIEAYQVQLLNEEKQPQKPVAPVMTAAEQEAAIKFLKRPDLMDQIIEDLETIGHVGEENRKLLGYLIAVSRKLERPLSGIVISQSGAGKSGLVEKIQELTPPEDVEFFSRITPQALYYMEPDALKRKLLIIEERTGGEGADYSIRTLQSRQKLTQAVPIKDPNSGKIKTMTFEVEGPIAYLETTTNPNLNHENATRCFEIFLDESIEQTRRIHQAQREAKTVKGILRKAKAEAIKNLHHNAQRLLKTVPVHNPYVLLLDFPADSLRTRRDHERFLSLIEAVTFLHQYQRPTKQIDAGNGEQIACIESTVDDYAIAYRVACEILGFSLDDLKKHARDLLDQIQEMVKRESRETGQIETEITFTRRQIREFTSWPDYQIKTYIKQLEDLEYLILQQVKTRGQFEYRLNDPNQPKPLKGLLTPEELKNLLLTQNPSVTTGTTGRNGLSAGQSQAGQDLAATGTEKVKNLEGNKKRGSKPKVSLTPSVTTGTTGRKGLSTG
jgi:DNA primase